MRRLRNLNHCPKRNTCRYASRMLGGTRRPPPPNYLAIACRALNEAIKIRERLLPFMEEQRQMLEQWLRDQEIEAALRKVYGEPAPGTPRRPSAFELCMFPNSRSEAVLVKEELALAKSRLLVSRLKATLENR